MKEYIKNVGLFILLKSFGLDLLDRRTGKVIGRVVVVRWRGAIRVIGLRGLAVRPHFLVQDRETYWAQDLGFSTHAPPDFPGSRQLEVVRETGIRRKPDEVIPTTRIILVLISHQSPPEVTEMVRLWGYLNPGAEVHVAYGGREEAFREISWQGKTFVADGRLRTRDHQRERQSYRGVMQAVVEGAGIMDGDRVVMVECDVFPLRAGLVEYLAGRAAEEKADVLGARLRRADGTCHPHVLAHEFHPAFREWLGASVREEKSVVLMMLGCLSWWTGQAFRAAAYFPEPLPVYLEIAMPTAAHLAGFRVRDLPEFYDDMEPLGELGHLVKGRQAAGRWVLHPCKEIWKKI